MSFRLVSSGGAVVEPAVVNLAASGTIWPGKLVDLGSGGTGGAIVNASSSSSTTTMVIGVSQSYVQGASDTFANVVLIVPGQLWEADCANAASTAQLGLRHVLSASDAACVHNTATDVTTQTGVFLALAMTSSTSGSGKLVGILQGYSGKLVPVNSTIYKQ